MRERRYVVRAVLGRHALCQLWNLWAAFELMDGRPVKHGSEEYLDSEKYQIRQWDLKQPNSLADLLARLNHIRRTNPALQHDRGLKFHNTDNPAVVCFSKKQGRECGPRGGQHRSVSHAMGEPGSRSVSAGSDRINRFKCMTFSRTRDYRWQGNASRCWASIPDRFRYTFLPCGMEPKRSGF